MRLRVDGDARAALRVRSRSAPAQHRSARKPAAEVIVNSVHLEGVQAVDEGELKSVLATKASSRLPWGEKHAFSQEDFNDDLKRIRAFYADRGYPAAKVLDHDLDVQRSQGRSRHHDPRRGRPPVVIQSVDFFGFDVLPATTLNFLKRTLTLKAGEVRRQGDLVAARDRAQLMLNERGYPYARVQALEGPGTKPNTVTITLAAEPGRQAKFGPVEITGNSSVSKEVIRRQLAFGEGDQFRMSRVAESQRRLYNLELFQYVNFDVPDLAAQPEQVPVKAVIQEGKHRRVGFGVGYGSEDKARVTANWRHVNFFGGARTLGLEGKYSSLDRGVRANFTEPYFFSPSYKLTLSAQNWYANEPAFTLLTRGGRASISREIARRDPTRRRFSTTRASLSFINEFEHQTISNEALNDPTFRDELIALGLDPRSGDQEGTVVALAFDISHDTTRNLLDARNGYVLSLHLEQAGSWLPGDFSYYETVFEGRHYITVSTPLRGRQPCAPRVDHLAGIRRRQRAVLQALLPGRIHEPARLVAVSGESAQRLGPADRRLHGARRLVRAALSDSRQFLRRAVRRLRQRLEPRLGFQSGRHGLCGRPRTALQHSYRAGALRLRVSVEAGRQPGRRRRARAAPLAHSFQHRPGVLIPRPNSTTMRILRRLLRYLMMTVAVLMVVILLGIGYTQTGWFKDWLRRYIVREAAQYLNGELRIGKVSGSLFYGIRMSDIALVQDGETVIALKDLRVDYSAFRLVASGIVLDEIELNQPVVRARRTGDGWNLMRLVKRQARERERTGPGRPITLPSIVIHDGRVRIDRGQETGKTVGQQIGQVGGQVPTQVTEISDLDVKAAFAYQPVRFTVDIANVSFKSSSPTFALSALSGKVAVAGDDIHIDRLFDPPAGNRAEGERAGARLQEIASARTAGGFEQDDVPRGWRAAAGGAEHGASALVPHQDERAARSPRRRRRSADARRRHGAGQGHPDAHRSAPPHRRRHAGGDV